VLIKQSGAVKGILTERDMAKIDDKALSPEMEEAIFKSVTSIPEKFYFVSSGKEAFDLNMYPSWSAYKDIQDKLEASIQERGIKLKIYERVLFPLDKSKFCSYFNLSGILKDRFGLDIEDAEENEPEHEKNQLSMTEKRVIYGLIKYPELTVAKLSKNINVSVPTICKVRKEMLANGLLKIINFPDFTKIGMELLVLNHSKFSPGVMQKSSKKQDNLNPNSFFTITSNTDCVNISVYEDYTQAKENMEKYGLHNAKEGKDTHNLIVPIEKVRFPKLDFVPLIKKMFNLDF
ncbi:hypothetical protein ACFLZ6_02330, partial [Nanoarchaeota archaeon]